MNLRAIAHAAQGGVDGVLTHWSLARADARKDVPAVPGDGLALSGRLLQPVANHRLEGIRGLDFGTLLPGFAICTGIVASRKLSSQSRASPANP